MPGLSLIVAASVAAATAQAPEDNRAKLEKLAATLNRTVGRTGDERSDLRFIGAEPGYNSISLMFQTQGQFTAPILAAFNGMNARSVGLCEIPKSQSWMLHDKIDVQVIFFAGSASRMERKISFDGCSDKAAAAEATPFSGSPATGATPAPRAASVEGPGNGSRDAVWRDAVVTYLRNSLIDPESARITAPFGFTPQLTTWKIWGVNETGYFTCGTVNSRNRFGGYVGSAVFVGIIRADGRVEATIDSDKYPILSKLCATANLPRLQE